MAALDPARRVVGARVVVDSDQSNTRHNRSACYIASLDRHKHLWNDFFFADFDGYVRFVRFADSRILAGPGRRFLLSGPRLRAEVDPQGLFGSPTLRAAILGG